MVQKSKRKKQEIKSILNQMEEGSVNDGEQCSIFSQQCPSFQELQLQPNEDQQDHIIATLLEQNLPIFIVTLCSKKSRAKEQIDKEMIKQKILSYNRKEKSLEQLCKKFIQHFEGKDGVILELDKVTVELNVERRRIYDIINILESLQVVKKAGKNNYVWRGLKQAIKTIGQLSTQTQDSTPTTHKKQKSLQHLAYRFLKLFLTQTESLTLEDAAKVLIHTNDSALVKTKIRRLYDIVNVFKSLGLVQKMHIPSKKPGFEWLGFQRLKQLIAERKQKVSDQKENNKLPFNQKENSVNKNNQRVKPWFSDEQQREFIKFRESTSFSQKLFIPSVIKRETSAFTLVGSQENLTDVCAQY